MPQGYNLLKGTPLITRKAQTTDDLIQVLLWWNLTCVTISLPHVTTLQQGFSTGLIQTLLAAFLIHFWQMVFCGTGLS